MGVGAGGTHVPPLSTPFAPLDFLPLLFAYFALACLAFPKGQSPSLCLFHSQSKSQSRCLLLYSVSQSFHNLAALCLPCFCRGLEPGPQLAPLSQPEPEPEPIKMPRKVLFPKPLAPVEQPK